MKEAIGCRWRYCLGIRVHKTREASVLASIGTKLLSDIGLEIFLSNKLLHVSPM